MMKYKKNKGTKKKTETREKGIKRYKNESRRDLKKKRFRVVTLKLKIGLAAIYIYIYIVLFGPVKPELGVILSGQKKYSTVNI